MSIFCAITSLFQLVVLVALTGVLVSVAAVSRLMEVTISLIHPMTIFLLRQSGKLIIWLVNRTARLTSRVFNRMCTMECRKTPVEIGRTAPEIPYARSVIPGMVQETNPLANDGEIMEVEPIEPSSSVEVEQENNGEAEQENGREVVEAVQINSM